MQALWPFVWLWVGEVGGVILAEHWLIISLPSRHGENESQYNQLIFSWCWLFKMFYVFLLDVFAWLLSLILNTLSLGIFWHIGWPCLCSFPLCGSLITDIQTFMCKVYLEVFTCIIDMTCNFFGITLKQ